MLIVIYISINPCPSEFMINRARIGGGGTHARNTIIPP